MFIKTFLIEIPYERKNASEQLTQLLENFLVISFHSMCVTFIVNLDVLYVCIHTHPPINGYTFGYNVL